MRFVVVNGRTPRSAICACCSEPLSDRYVRELASRLPYCDVGCQDRHIAAGMPPPQAKPSRLWLLAGDGGARR